MQLTRLKQLHADMQRQGIGRLRFQLAYNHLRFVGVFLADVTPYELALAAVGHEFVLLFEVDRHHETLAYLKDKTALEALKKALKIHGNDRNAFRLSDFLREIDAGLPTHAVPAQAASHADVARLYRDVEEADKIHFVNFVPHAPQSGRHASAANLAKTRRLLGEASYEFCRRHNISSCWTDIAPLRPNVPVLPDITGLP